MDNVPLVTDRQWAYRAGYSTELLLVHLTEEWRKAVNSRLVVAVAFIDFKKAFDSVSHTILEMKLQRDFGVDGSLLDWLRSYLKDRRQFTIVNGTKSGDTSRLLWHSSRVRSGTYTVYTVHERSSSVSQIWIGIHVRR